MAVMVDNWRLATISMWVQRLDKDVALKLIDDHFTWNDLWDAAVELNQLCAERTMSQQIPRNPDQGDLKDRVRVLASAMLGSMQELKNRANKPVFVASSEQLFQGPGVVRIVLR